MTPITKETPPVFPCWLWSGNAKYSMPGWFRREEFQWAPGAMPHYTHWHPDQPEAPTVTPEVRPIGSVGPEEAERLVDAMWAKFADTVPTELACPEPKQQGETPMTDSFEKQLFLLGSRDGHTVHSENMDFARRLERELNEAKAEVQFLRNVNDGLADECNKLSGECERPSAVEENVRLRARLTALESELALAKGEALSRKTQLMYVQSELAEARRDKERLERFAQIVWDARRGTGDNEQHTEELNNMAGIVAEIRSRNFQFIDATMSAARPASTGFATGQGVSLLPCGTKVKILHYTPGFGGPSGYAGGKTGTIASVRQAGQSGHDYHVAVDGGGSVALNHGEVNTIPASGTEDSP